MFCAVNRVVFESKLNAKIGHNLDIKICGLWTHNLCKQGYWTETTLLWPYINIDHNGSLLNLPFDRYDVQNVSQHIYNFSHTNSEYAANWILQLSMLWITMSICLQLFVLVNVSYNIFFMYIYMIHLKALSFQIMCQKYFCLFSSFMFKLDLIHCALINGQRSRDLKQTLFVWNKYNF